MNSGLQLIIIILFILLLLNKIYPIQRYYEHNSNNKSTSHSNNKSTSHSNKDKFWNTNKKGNKMTKEECDVLFNQDEAEKEQISDMQSKCCTYTRAIENNKTNIMKTKNDLLELKKNKNTVSENIKKLRNCSMKERELIDCINEKIRENNKDADNIQLQEVKAADFYQNFFNLIKEEDNKSNIGEIEKIIEISNECLNKYIYFKDENKKEACSVIFGKPLMDEFIINRDISNKEIFLQNEEKKLKDHLCGECHQCVDEPEANCATECEDVKPIQGSYNVLFLTETKTPPPELEGNDITTLSKNTTISKKNLEEKIAKEVESRKANNEEIFGKSNSLSKEEQIKREKEFRKEINKELEEKIGSSLLAAEKELNHSIYAPLEKASDSKILSYDSGDTQPNMKVDGDKISHTYQVNQNQMKKVNEILGYDVDEINESSLLKNVNKSKGELNNIKTNLGYKEIDGTNFPNDHLYNNITNLSDSIQNANLENPVSANSSSVPNGSAPPTTYPTSNIHHHYHQSNQNPKMYYKTNKDSKLIPLITQENIDGVSNVFAPYIHLEIPPHFTAAHDI
tara:strand:- start:65 stop:1768 length:1704 start_codon:yes stop_codon:yes gene_type:complete